MSIFEYDEEVELKKLRAAEYEYGKMEGEEIGEVRGENNVIISMVCQKLKKHYPVSKIADELERDEEEIEKLCEIARKYAPDYNVEIICKEVMECK